MKMHRAVMFIAAGIACACSITLNLPGEALAAKTDDADVAKQEVKAATDTAKLSGKWTYKKVSLKGKTTKQKISYRYSDNTYPSGVVAIGKSSYYFKSSKGKLSTSKKAQRLVKQGGANRMP